MFEVWERRFEGVIGDGKHCGIGDYLGAFGGHLGAFGGPSGALRGVIPGFWKRLGAS